MSINTTHLPVDLPQLDEEIRVAAGLDQRPGLSMREIPAPTEANPDRVKRVIICDHDAVTQTLLDDVVDAHVPADPPPTDAERIASLKAQLAAVQAATDELTDIVFEELLS